MTNKNKECLIDKCSDKVLYKGMCEKHYNQHIRLMKEGISKEKAIEIINNKCKVKGCQRITVKNGYCQYHYDKYILNKEVTESDKVKSNIRDKDSTKICTVDGCFNEHKEKGYCEFHYNQMKRFGQIVKLYKPEFSIEPKECMVENCNKHVVSMGYCNKHYKQFKKYKRILNDNEVDKIVHKKCTEQNCENKIFKLGYCKEHYNKYFGVDNMNNESNETITTESVVTKSPVKIDNPNENILPDKEIFKCDKCGEDINNNNISNMKFTPFKDSSSIELNLCHKCSSNLIKWMLKRQ